MTYRRMFISTYAITPARLRCAKPNIAHVTEIKVHCVSESSANAEKRASAHYVSLCSSTNPFHRGSLHHLRLDQWEQWECWRSDGRREGSGWGMLPQRGFGGITPGKFWEFEMLPGALTAFLAHSSLQKWNFNALDILTMGTPFPCVLVPF